MISLHVPDIVLMMRERGAVACGLMSVVERMFSLLLTYHQEEEVMMLVDWDPLLGSREEDGCQLTSTNSGHLHETVLSLDDALCI